jgi:hypothetical protein
MRAAILASILCLCAFTSALAQTNLTPRASALDRATATVGTFNFSAAPEPRVDLSARDQGTGLQQLLRLLLGTGADRADRTTPDAIPAQNPPYLLQW